MDLLYRKQGLPEESEIVTCEVTKVYYNSVFVNIIEYDVQGMIHISEISPGRIRNIGDYVKVGKVIICKVLRVNQQRGHVDLSLRRVNQAARREKADQIKQEQKAEKIIELVAKDLKIRPKELYDTVSEKVFKDYEMLHMAFEEVVSKNELLTKLDIPQKFAKPLTELILQRIKPPVYKIIGSLKLVTYDADGIEKIKKVLCDVIKKKKVDIKYSGAGKFRMELEADDFRSGETLAIETADLVKKGFEKFGSVEFEIEKKLKI